MNFGYLFAAKALAYPMAPAMAWWGWLLVILGIILTILIILGFIGSKLQKKQALQREQIEQMAQTMSMIVIDKKKMRMCDANLPKVVMEQTPKRFRRAKLPFVKVKIGPKIMTLIADAKIFESIPVKKEVKGVVSGIYLTDIKSVRGGSIPAPEKKGRKNKKEK